MEIVNYKKEYCNHYHYLQIKQNNEVLLEENFYPLFNEMKSLHLAIS